MAKQMLRLMLLIIIVAVFIISAVFVFILHSELFTGVLYGAAGVGLFMVLAKILSLIQKEGKQDD